MGSLFSSKEEEKRKTNNYMYHNYNYNYDTYNTYNYNSNLRSNTTPISNYSFDHYTYKSSNTYNNSNIINRSISNNNMSNNIKNSSNNNNNVFISKYSSNNNNSHNNYTISFSSNNEKILDSIKKNNNIKSNKNNESKKINNNYNRIVNEEDNKKNKTQKSRTELKSHNYSNIYNNNYYIKENNNYNINNDDEDYSSKKNDDYYEKHDDDYYSKEDDDYYAKEDDDNYDKYDYDYYEKYDDYHAKQHKHYPKEEYDEYNEEEDDYGNDIEEDNEEDDDYYDDEDDINEDNEEDDDCYDDDEDDIYYDNDDYNDNYYNKNQIENEFIFDNSSNFTQMVDDDINPNPYLNINNDMLKILMIAEKPSIAKIISKILCQDNKLRNFTKKKGWCYYSFIGKFKGKDAKFIVSSVTGHLYQTEFLRKHRNFRIDPIELFDAPSVKKDSNDNTCKIETWLNKLANNKDILCLWLDCDREGENICYEVIYNTLPYMNKRDYQQIYRAIFSSLTKKDILESFEKLENYPDNNLSLSVDARQVIDLKVGVSLTRFLTSNILPYLPENEVDSKFISYGPCQTPTLWFCVNREKEMEKQNLTYYKIYIELFLKKSKVKIYLDEEYKNKNLVKNIIKSLKKFNYIKINNLIREKRTKKHPLGLNTATLLKIASTNLSYSPQFTMNIAQNLYMKGYITYPRTETNVYSSSFDFKTNLKKISKDKIENKELIRNLKDIDFMSEEGIDAGDHPPITPSRKPAENRLTKKELDLFNLIRDYYFASISPDLEYENITYEFSVDSGEYKSTCSIVNKEGFSKYFDFQQKEFLNKDEILEKNKLYKIINVSFEEKKKDSYISEAELIEEMEKNHIGTDASMSVHIENIEKRGYVKVDENRRLIPTKLGKALIEALEAVEPDIILPKNRATIESFVNDLADGKKDYEEVLNYSLKFYKEKYINVTEKIDDLLEIFSQYFDLNEDY